MTVTIGEALSRRKLKKIPENAGRVEIYVPGQFKATKLGAVDAIVSGVDREGAVVIVPVELVGDTWRGRGVLLRATTTTVEARSVPYGNPIRDDGMLRAIQAATKDD